MLQAPVVRLPHNFIFRDFQRDVFKARFIERKRNLISVTHRRAGKTKVALNMLISAAAERIGLYYHLFPELNQARKVVWNGIDNDSRKYLDHIPKRLIAGKPNQTEMRIDLINGSILQLVGSDNYNSLRGTNPRGVVADEYSFQHPMGMQVLRPILAENGGFTYYVYTPLGHNHGYDLYNSALKNPNWFVQRLTVDDTGGIVTQETIDEERAAGVPEEIIQQEYYCSFEVSLVGSFYGQFIDAAYKEDRVRKFEIVKNIPVFTYWDIGFRDQTAIWFMQVVEGQLRMIYYYENQGQYIKHYADKLKEISEKLGIRYAHHFAPHDSKQEKMISERSPLRTAYEVGINFNIVPSMGVMAGINAARALFSRVHFHEENCKLGIQCLKEYKKEWDNVNKCYGTKPLHNWASNGADAFRYFGVSWNKGFSEPQSGTVIELPKPQI